MRYQIIFYCITLILVASCNQDKKTTTQVSEKKENTSVIDSSLIGKPVTDADMADDSVFTDGSIPTEWKVAGITNVSALKIFIKDIQSIVAADNKEELSKHIRYPLNKKIKTEADFSVNYNKIVTPNVKTALAKVNFRQLFRNYQGVMIGNGEIWIVQEGKDFKIIAINN